MYAASAGSGGVALVRPYYAEGMNVYLPGGCLTPFCATWPPVTQTIRYGIRAYPGYQHIRTRMNFANGTVALHDPPGLWATTTTVTVNNATTPVNAYAEMVEQPTLEVEVKVEDDIVPAAYAGHYTFSTNGYSPAKKFSTYQVETLTYSKYTELYAVTAAPHENFDFVAWTGNCAYFDANGNYLGMLPETLPEDPEEWITDRTIYVKCLKAEGVQEAYLAPLTSLALSYPSEQMTVLQNACITANLGRYAIVVRGDIGNTNAQSKLKDIGFQVNDLSIGGGPSGETPEQGENRIATAINKKPWDPHASVFHYSGHGNTTAAQLFLREDGTAVLNPGHIMDRSRQWKLVFLSCCSQWAHRTGWLEQLTPDAFVAWDDEVDEPVADAFCKAFWNTLCSTTSPHDAQEAFDAGVDAANNHLWWYLGGKPHIEGNTTLALSSK